MFLLRRLDLALADARSNNDALPGSGGLSPVDFATVQDGDGVEKHSLYKE